MDAACLTASRARHPNASAFSFTTGSVHAGAPFPQASLRNYGRVTVFIAGKRNKKRISPLSRLPYCFSERSFRPVRIPCPSLPLSCSDRTRLVRLEITCILRITLKQAMLTTQRAQWLPQFQIAYLPFTMQIKRKIKENVISVSLHPRTQTGETRQTRAGRGATQQPQIKARGQETQQTHSPA